MASIILGTAGLTLGGAVDGGGTVGATLGNTDEQSFSYSGKLWKPYSPVHITAERNGSDNLTIAWVRRSRAGGGWRDYVDVPLNESQERYEVDIMDGGVVVRTLSASTPEVSYSATDQATDFGSAQSSVDVRIYQLSDVIGRGYPGDATV